MPRLPLLLDSKTLNQWLMAAPNSAQLLIVDLSKAAVHNQVHIPGAIWLDSKLLQSGEESAPGSLPPLPHIQHIMQQLGLTPSTHVVVYDDEGGGWAGRFMWTLDVIGHTQSSFLNGGIHAWLAEGFTTASGKSSLPQPASDFRVGNINTTVRSDMADILQRLTQPEHFSLWDCRSEEEYHGTRLAAKRGGHIPGAKHYEWTTAMDKNHQLRLRPLETIRLELENCGIIDAAQADRVIITYCQAHHRSGFTYMLGKILGLNIRAYDGAWSEWGNRHDTPIETHSKTVTV